MKKLYKFTNYIFCIISLLTNFTKAPTALAWDCPDSDMYVRNNVHHFAKTNYEAMQALMAAQFFKIVPPPAQVKDLVTENILKMANSKTNIGLHLRTEARELYKDLAKLVEKDPQDGEYKCKNIPHSYIKHIKAIVAYYIYEKLHHSNRKNKTSSTNNNENSDKQENSGAASAATAAAIAQDQPPKEQEQEQEQKEKQEQPTTEENNTKNDQIENTISKQEFNEKSDEQSDARSNEKASEQSNEEIRRPLTTTKQKFHRKNSEEPKSRDTDPKRDHHRAIESKNTTSYDSTYLKKEAKRK